MPWCVPHACALLLSLKMFVGIYISHAGIYRTFTVTVYVILEKLDLMTAITLTYKQCCINCYISRKWFVNYCGPEADSYIILLVTHGR